MKITAPAKINLYLEIGKKRKDGYHELTSLFQTVGLYDEMEIHLPTNWLEPSRGNLPVGGEVNPTISLRVFPAQARKICPENSKNLVWRAVELFQKKFSISSPVKILLKKRIPVQAGLGGGSSDAAATLKTLAQLFPNHTKISALKKIALQLGADVPFFLEGGCALASGIGERIRSLFSSPKFWCVIVKPSLGLSTAEVYRWLDQDNLKGVSQDGLTSRQNLNKILYLIKQKKSAQEWSRYIYNSLERSVYKRVTMLSHLKEKIIQYGAWNACLSGSGSALFGIVSSQSVGEKIKQKLQGRGREIWVVHSL